MSQKHEPTFFRTVFIPALILLGVLIFVVAGVQSLGANALEGQVDTMAQSLRRNAVQCYVLEGAYPQDLDYLAENYNLSLNNEEFVYHYTYWGSNIMPDIFVFRK